MDLASEKYVSFTTFRKNGDPVSTPVWIVSYNGRLAFTTESDAGKVKRLRNYPSVTLRACDMRGKVAEGSPVFTGTAEVVAGAEHKAVWRLVRRKYWLLAPALSVGGAVKRLFGRSRPADTAVLITLTG